jgi:hypothetical protein
MHAKLVKRRMVYVFIKTSNMYSMAMDEEVCKNVENHIKLMTSQVESYLPFLKSAFPFSSNLSEACFSLIVGSALSVFIYQYSMRLKVPSSEDFEEFGKLTLKYRDRIEQFFK